VVVELANAGVV